MSSPSRSEVDNPSPNSTLKTEYRRRWQAVRCSGLWARVTRNSEVSVKSGSLVTVFTVDLWLPECRVPQVAAMFQSGYFRVHTVYCYEPFPNLNLSLPAYGKKRNSTKELIGSQFEIRVSTESGPDESARSVGRGAINQEHTSTGSRPRQLHRWPKGEAAAGGRRRMACHD